MTSKLFYKDQDITLDVMIKIEHVVTIIAEHESCLFDEAYRAFAASNAYQALVNTRSLLWSESAEYIVDEFERERTVHLRSS